MTTETMMSNDGSTLTVSLPLNIRKRGGRKQVVVPENASWSAPAKVDGTMAKAIARAFRWRKLLETGVYATIEELAATEAINPSYVSRILRLTLLSPDIVEAVLDGTHAREMTIATLMKPIPVAGEPKPNGIPPRVNKRALSDRLLAPGNK
jgi:hypothetical protein